jgi:transposase
VSGLESLSREELLTLLGVSDRTVELLKTQNGELRASLAQALARIAELERRAGRNSGNSSQPPSADGFVKPDKPKAPPSGRRRGGQPGARGGGLALVEHPDATVDRFPPACGGCGTAFRGLGECDSVGFTARQCTDIPPVSAVVTETRWHRVRCGCGHTTAAIIPADVPDNPCYGPQIQTLAVYLVVFQHVPLERAAALIADLTGAAPSTGWIASLLPRAASLVAGSLRLIKALLTLGHVLHADETTTNIAGKRRYLHAACTEKLTFLGLAPRSRAGADSLGVLPHFRGTMVHDAYFQLYDGYPNASHQLCCAHVIRELTAQHELFAGQVWAGQIRWALAQLIKQARRAREAGLPRIPPEWIGLYLRIYHQGVAVGLRLHPRTHPSAAQSDATNLLERLRDHAPSYLHFTDDLHVEPTNNRAERDQRPVKTQVKISGCHQSETGAATWLALRSYVSSATKHGVPAFEALRLAMTGTPWTPPIALEC